MTGEINSTNYTVWVNGVSAALSTSTNGEGVYTWEATNVPMAPNSSLVQASAIPYTDNGGNGSGGGEGVNPWSAGSQDASAAAENSGVYVSLYSCSYLHAVDIYAFTNDLNASWANGSGGQSVITWLDGNIPYYEIDYGNWPSNSWPLPPPTGTFVEYVNGSLYWQGTVPPFAFGPKEHTHADFEMTYPDFSPPAHEHFTRIWRQS